jgi:hypothetical protein
MKIHDRDAIESLKNRIRGWLPEKSKVTLADTSLKPRWRKPYWVALTAFAFIGFAFIAYIGVQTYIRYSNPQADVTASYFEKSLNCSTARVGDVVEVNVLVGWHGYVLPEFKRQVEIFDPYPESNFQLAGGNNTYKYSGYGGGDQFTYLLKVTEADAGFIELPKPRLYLDNTEILLNGKSISLEIR